MDFKGSSEWWFIYVVLMYWWWMIKILRCKIDYKNLVNIICIYILDNKLRKIGLN
jgi:hypothetical protein